jgi:hypothetical protein
MASGPLSTGEHRVHFVQCLREGPAELLKPDLKTLRDVRHETAHAGQAGGEPGSGPRLLQVIEAFPLIEAPEKGREGPQVDAGGTKPDQMGDDPADFAGDHPEHLAALGDLDAHQLLDRERQADIVGHGAQVVGAVGEGHNLIVVPVLAQLLESRMQIADMRDDPYHGLAVQLDHQPEHAVGGGVLGPDVDEHVLRAEIVLGGVILGQGDAQRKTRRAALGVEARGRERDLDGTGAH